jgi:hypothetical protein
VVVKKRQCHTPRVRAGPLLVASSVCLLLISGCYWLRYHDLVLTHAELIEDLAEATLPQLETAPAAISPGDVERLRYPLERAQHFLGIAAKRRAGNESLRALDALVGVYARFLVEMERVRAGVVDGALSPGGADAVAAATALVADVRSHAARVREAVERERAES